MFWNYLDQVEIGFNMLCINIILIRWKWNINMLFLSQLGFDIFCGGFVLNRSLHMILSAQKGQIFAFIWMAQIWLCGCRQSFVAATAEKLNIFAKVCSRSNHLLSQIAENFSWQKVVLQDQQKKTVEHRWEACLDSSQR